jgi:peroxiredoxin
MVAVGDHIPDIKVMINTAEGIKPAQMGELLGTGKVVLFAVPGAFTPGCSEYHLPATSPRGPTSRPGRRHLAASPSTARS